MHRSLSVALLAFPFCIQPATAAAPDCLDTGLSQDYWRPVREQAPVTKLPADEYALELVGCLGSPDPELRDSIGYELFSYWLRQEELADDTRAALLTSLQARLDDPAPDASLSRSFSALVLAELMRSDARSPFMSDADRQSLLESVSSAIAAETDYRGLDPDIGWVHPVAHMADLLWRFALHPATSDAQASALLAAVQSKVAPPGVSYAFNEGDRLARVAATIIGRDLLPHGDVVRWLGNFSAPRSMEQWSDAFRSPAGMAELHDTKQFLRALSDQLDGAEIDRDVASALADLVRSFTALI